MANFFSFQASGVGVHPDVDSTFQEIKLGHKYRYVIYKISGVPEEIIVESKGDNTKTYADFLALLPKVCLLALAKLTQTG